MIQAPKKRFKKWLVDGETISFSEYSNKRIIPKKLSYLLFVILMIIFIIIVIFKPILMIFPAMLLALLSTIPTYYNTFTDAGGNPFSIKEFAFTNKRILIIDVQERLTAIDYKDIYNLNIRNKSLEIIIQPLINPSIITISTSGSIKEIKQHLTNSWTNESPYTSINSELIIFTKKHNLVFKSNPLEENPNLNLEGEIDGVPFTFTFKTIYDSLYLEATIECRNEEKNFFSIYPEKSMDSIAKLVGKQDYKIGVPEFDKKFIIQSNHKKFIENILQEEMLDKINKATVKLQGKIIMGIPQKIKKIKKPVTSNNDTTLDAHLISENTRKINRFENFTSTLTYTPIELKGYKKFENLVPDIILNLEMLISLAKRINDYDKK